MAAASNYTIANVLNAILRGTVMPLPAGTYISLHTANPGATGANEATLVAWPNYVRRNAEAGGAIGSGWSAASGGQSQNSNQMTWPNNNGAAPITITHFGIWDAANAGNLLAFGALTASRTLAVGDILVFDVHSLTTSMT